MAETASDIGLKKAGGFFEGAKLRAAPFAISLASHRLANGNSIQQPPTAEPQTRSHQKDSAASSSLQRYGMAAAAVLPFAAAAFVRFRPLRNLAQKWGRALWRLAAHGEETGLCKWLSRKAASIAGMLRPRIWVDNAVPAQGSWSLAKTKSGAEPVWKKLFSFAKKTTEGGTSGSHGIVRNYNLSLSKRLKKIQLDLESLERKAGPAFTSSLGTICGKDDPVTVQTIIDALPHVTTPRAVMTKEQLVKRLEDLADLAAQAEEGLEETALGSLRKKPVITSKTIGDALKDMKMAILAHPSTGGLKAVPQPRGLWEKSAATKYQSAARDLYEDARAAQQLHEKPVHAERRYEARSPIANDLAKRLEERGDDLGLKEFHGFLDRTLDTIRLAAQSQEIHLPEVGRVKESLLADTIYIYARKNHSDANAAARTAVKFTRKVRSGNAEAFVSELFPHRGRRPPDVGGNDAAYREGSSVPWYYWRRGR